MTVLLLMLMTTTMMAQQFNEVQYTPEKTTFVLFAPQQAKSVKVSCATP